MAPDPKVVERIRRKRMGLPVDDLEPEQPTWEPKSELERERYREVGRRTSAESRARSADAVLVASIGLEHLREQSGYDFNSSQVFAALRTVFDEGGQAALDLLIEHLGEALDEDEIEELGQHADLANAHAQRDEMIQQAEAEVENRALLQATDERVLQEHADVLQRSGVNEATGYVLNMLEGGETHPLSTDDPAERENLLRGAVTLGNDLAKFRAIQQKKYEVMNSVPRLGGEDQSLPRDEARFYSLNRLGIIDDQGFIDDSEWDPSETASKGYVKKTPAEIQSEDDLRRYEIREALDHPAGYPDGHPLSTTPDADAGDDY